MPLALLKNKSSPWEQWGTKSFSSTEQQQPQDEASTLLHESPNSKPETIEQREIVFHHVRVWVARMWVVPFVGAKPIKERTYKETKSAHKAWNCEFSDGNQTADKTEL